MINISEIDQDFDEWYYEDYMQDYLLSLLSTSTFERQRFIEMEINERLWMNKAVYDKLLTMLLNNQLDRITSGLPYSQTDILKHLRKL